MFWPWVLGIVLLALVVWVVAQLSDPPPAERSVPIGQSQASAPSAPATEAGGPVAAAGFQAWVRDSAVVLERDPAGAYAVRGLQRLAAAVRGLASEGGDSVLVARADQLTARVGATPPGAVVSADSVVLMFGAAADVVEALDPGADVSVARNLEQARAAAAQLDPTLPLDPQRHRIYRYFDFMGGAVAVLGAAASAAL
ncbi:MAG: hypothetical protein WEF86_04530 [Gemmatimonadota bacterium]